MKTKNLMTAFALSAMFAACSQDTELNETLAKNDFSNIPMVEAEFTADFGVESRMQKKFGLEEGDKVGLAWLGSEAARVGGSYSGLVWSYEGQAYQNHPLFCTNASTKAFKTETMLYVGEYFAYMPYTESQMTVEYIPFSIEKQTLTTNANDLAKQAIYLSTENVTLQKADEDGNVDAGNQKAGMGNNVKLSLSLLNNPTTIKFAFKNIDALTDLKVTGVTIDMKDATYTGGSVMPVSFRHNGNVQDWTEWSGKDFFTWNAGTPGAVELKGELAVANNALTTYALLLPSKFEVSTLAKLNITLNTNYGIVEAKNVKIDNAKLFSNFGVAATVTAEVDGKEILNTTASVKTQAELEEVLTKLAASAQKDAVSITLNPATAATPDKAPFTLTDFTLPEGLKAKVNLTAGDKTNGTIEFAGTTIINKPIIVHSTSVVTGNMTVNYIKNETTLNHIGLTVSHDAVLTNNGVISGNIKTVAADEEEELGFGKFITNYKDAKLINGSTVENLGETQWIAGEVPAVLDNNSNSVYAAATSLEEIGNADDKGVKVIRLTDVTLENEYDDYTFSNVRIVECYGVVNFNLKATKNTAKGIYFASGSHLNVKENAEVRVWSNNKENNLGVAIVNVEKNAYFYIQNVATAINVHNAGSVSVYNAPMVTKASDEEGSNWTNTEWK